MAYDNTNSGALFKNERREKESHPHARGNAEVICPHCNGVAKFWISAWTNIAKQGKRMGQKFQSLAFTAMDDQPTDKGVVPDLSIDGIDEDIPF